MTERTCGNCRWHRQVTSTGVSGECRRHPPTRGRMGWSWPSTDSTYWCGEWADKSITPAQQERRELVRQFAVVIVQGIITHPTLKGEPGTIWKMAEEMADAEPGLVAKSDS